MGAIVWKLGWHGLLCNKMKEYLATLLYDWMVMKCNEISDNKQQFNSDSDEDAVSVDHGHYNCGLQIKTPSSKKKLCWKPSRNVFIFMVPILNASSGLQNPGN